MEENKTKIFITGASGFIGRHLLKEINTLNANFYLLIRVNERVPDFPYSNIQWIKGDLNEPETYSEYVMRSDIVIHMASELYNNDFFWKTNVEAVEKLIDIINYSTVKKVIHLSSVGVVGMQYSSDEIIVNEVSECFPKNEYERTKLISEKLWKEKLNYRDLIIIRPTNVFGEEHPREHLKNLIEHIRNNKYFVCSKKSIVNYLYVDDIAASILFFLSSEKTTGTFNIGESMSLSLFINIIKRLNKSNCKIIYIPEFIFIFIKYFKFLFPLKIYQKIISLNNKVNYSDDKLKRYFQYPYGIETGLRNTSDYYFKVRNNA